ncbi:MAG: hypothetical protein KKF41_04705 [Actinobacteria bacterium]|nr:hypothetical protein [Actinomycetota bacterium]MBU2686866.1 hypothetical protein [Actinomycetota bacterium]
MKSRIAAVPAAACLLAAMFMLAAPGAPASRGPDRKTPDSITVRFDFPRPEVSGSGDAAVLSMEGCASSRYPGLPSLPRRSASYALPPGKTLTDLVVLEQRWSAPLDVGVIQWGYGAATSGEAARGPDPAVYESPDPYPSGLVEVSGTGMMRGISAATLDVTPVRYYPASGTIRYCEHLEVRLDCAESERAATPARDRSPEAPDPALFENAGEAAAWYAPEAFRGDAPSGTGNIADYVIICPAALSAAVAPLQTYKQTQGLSVNLTTTEWISTNCAGVDTQEKIRNFLRDNYLTWGITYVLIVGTDASVPMRDCWTPTGEAPPDDYTPTDYYYSDLSGDWDLNDDGNYGQYGVDDGVGGVDFYPEVYVGRIPLSVAGDVTSVCNKIVTFSQDSGAWKHKAILPGAISNFTNQDYSGWPATFGSYFSESIKNNITTPAGFSNYTLYEKEGLAADPPACDAPLTKANLLAEWPNDYGVVTWWGHGNSSGAYRTYWATDDGDGVPESGELSQPSFMSSGDVGSLDNAHPGIVFAVSCLNAYPETPSLASALVTNGASAVVAGTRITWYGIGWQSVDWGGNATMGYLFDKYLITDGHRCGKALRLANIEFLNEYLYFDVADYQNLFGLNLFGDPSMRLDAEGSPTVSQVSPDSHENTGSAGLTVTGDNFMTGAAVKLALAGQPDVVATGVSVDSPRSITCNVDLDDVHYGDWDVVVTNPDDSFGTLAAGFNVYCPTPTVTDITPPAGAVGGSVHVTDLAGTGFRSSATVQLQKGGEPSIDATGVTRVSDTQITCDFDLTGAATGQWNVFVENGGGKNATLTNGFTVSSSPPAVTGITPASGLNDGIVNITDLAGTGFLDGATVKLTDGVNPDIPASDVTVLSENQITCSFQLDAEPAGSRNVVVTNPDLQAGTGVDLFAVNNAPPDLVSINPDNGDNDGSVLMTLTGDSFRTGMTAELQGVGPDIPGVLQGVVGHTSATYLFDLTGAPLGLRDLYVQNDDVQGDTLDDCFTVTQAPPNVTGITPTSGLNNGIVNITDLSGTGFLDGATVRLSDGVNPDINGTGVTVVSPNQITCGFQLDAAPAGPRDVVVTNPDLQSGTGVDLFTVNNASPVLLSIVPDNGGNDGSVLVTLTGDSFRPGMIARLQGVGPLIGGVLQGAVTHTGATYLFDLTGTPPGLRDLYVRNDDGQGDTLYDCFTVNQVLLPPTIMSVDPPSVTNDGSASISIFGTDFRAGASVTIRYVGAPGGATGSVKHVQADRIDADFELWGEEEGHYDVIVRNIDLTEDTFENGLTVTQRSPRIDSVTPDTGANTGAVEITIDGDGFQPGVNAYLERGADTIQGVMNGLTLTEFRVRFDITGADPGLWDITVVNLNSDEDSLQNCFTVTSPVSGAWYLAEGTSDWGFDTYVTIENPNDTVVTAQVTYMTKTGPQDRPDLTLPPNSQTVINPRNDIGVTDFSTSVQCRQGKTICVDRRMVWQAPGAPSPEGHSSVGVTAPAKTWYLPEGSSKWGFETWLLIQNPNDEDAHVTITYMIEGQGPSPVTKTVEASSRASFNMAEDIGAQDASIKVASDVPVIPERAMYRNSRREGHDSIGTTTPSTDYYLAEGTTDWGFTTYVLVQNPNSGAATVNITYMTGEGPVSQDPFTMDPNSRKTVNVNTVVPDRDLSIKVHGSVPIIAERAMYWDSGMGEACHDSIGMDCPHATFYLPDGETTNGCETWTLIQNPNPEPVTVEVSYLTTDGTGNVTWTEEVGANSRKTFNMGDKIPAGRASIKVTCQTPGKKIMVERAMYWNNRGAGTDTIGGCAD